jgi:hypothetical protein
MPHQSADTFAIVPNQRAYIHLTCGATRNAPMPFIGMIAYGAFLGADDADFRKYR